MTTLLPPFPKSQPAGGGSGQGVFDVTSSAYGGGVDPTDHATDQTSKIAAAIAAASAAGGGDVVLPAIGANNSIRAVGLVLPSYVRLVGHGRGASILKAPDGASGAIVTWGDGAIRAGVEGVGFDGNKAGGATVDGIAVTGGATVIGDCMARISGVYVRNCRDGIRLDGGINLRMPFLIDFYIHQCTRYGLFISTTDGHVSHGAVGGSGNHGVYIQSGADFILTGVRSFYSGNNGATFNADASGFRIDPGDQRLQLTGCMSQDNGLYGFDVAADRVILEGCKFGGENQRLNANGGGIRVAGSNSRIRAQAATADLSGHGSHLIIDSATALDNDIEINGPNPDDGSAAAKTINTATVFRNRWMFNGQREAVIAPAATQATIQIRQGAWLLKPTVAVTASTHAYAVAGDVAEITLVPGAGGSFAMPAGTVYHAGFAWGTTAGVASSGRFLYDGTNWIQTG